MYFLITHKTVFTCKVVKICHSQHAAENYILSDESTEGSVYTITKHRKLDEDKMFKQWLDSVPNLSTHQLAKEAWKARAKLNDIL